jgi:hypothetical protein
MAARTGYLNTARAQQDGRDWEAAAVGENS